MRQLRYAGPGEDAGHVVVEALDASDRFTLVLDDALRSAARQELPRPGRADTDGAALSPREIQTRVRSGTSPEVVAEESGLTLEKVMRFAYPVLQERSRVADEARRARARQVSGPPDTTALGEVVDAAFAAHDIDPAEVAWDSFRRLDGQWTVTAGWREDEVDRFAQWNFALAHRAVSPLDDTADDLQHGRPLLSLPVDEPAPEPVEEPVVAAAADDGFEMLDDAARDAAAGVDRWGRPLVDSTLPTGPLPTGLRLAPPVVDADELAPGDPFAGAPWPADPAPRGLGSFFDPPAAGRHPVTGGPRDVDEIGADPVGGFDPDEPPLPFAFETVDAAPARSGRRGARHAQGQGAVDDADANPDGKAARARIPSWDDILLGVRRRGD